MAAFFCAAGFIYSQGTHVSLKYSGNGGYSLVERTNLRRYVNGKYVGLTSREVRSFIAPGLPPSKKFKAKGSLFEHDQWYDGSFYVMEETLRNNQAAGAPIHDSIQSMFHISPTGQLTMYKDNGYPSFRSFPAYTTELIHPGDSWKAQAERSVDPLNKGKFTKIPMLVGYTFSGEEEYRGQSVYRIKALWQTNYGPSVYDPAGDSSLVKAAGGHKADIIVLKETGVPVLVIDNVDETFAFTDGTQVNFKGTITLFTEFPPALDTEKLMLALNRVASVKGSSGESAVNSGASVLSGSEAGRAGSSGTADPAVTIADGRQASGSVKSPLVSSGGQGKPSERTAAPENISNNSLKNNILAEETPAGIRLSIRDIKFAPDSAEVLASENERLDQIAEVLKTVPDSQFLVEGHTASTGRPQGEQTLSEQRAHRIAEELSRRGVKAGAFICRGWGGNRPVASNDTDEGRAQNRRVEITILK